MDDLIYILVIAAWLAFSIYRRSQVKRNAGRDGNAPGRKFPVPSIDDVLMDDEAQSMEDIPAEPAWKRAGRPYTGRHADSQEGLSLEEAFGSAEIDKPPRQSRVAYVPIAEPVAEEQEEDRPASTEETEAIDLRQAVIYSEILNRPYL